MRISDWSSDVCSSDLPPERHPARARHRPGGKRAATVAGRDRPADRPAEPERTGPSRARHPKQGDGLRPCPDRLRSLQGGRPEERREGKEFVSTSRYGWSPYPSKKKKNIKIHNKL